MEYLAALKYLLGLADLERMVSPAGQRPRYTLDRMLRLLRLLGDPHRRVPAVHVTGTKGKGSTAAMINSILLAAGYSTGLYSSPHLHTFRERVRLGQTPLSEDHFAALVQQVQPVVELLALEGADGRPTTFEALTAMAFLCFAQQPCQYQVLEVGLGGTLDATNVVERPLVCVITSISLDHTAILGDTLGQIAADKAGIIKPGAAVVTAPQATEALEPIRRAAAHQGVELAEVGRQYRWSRGPWGLDGQHFTIEGPDGTFSGWIPLLGEHQLENAACALAAARALERRGVAIGPGALVEGFKRVQWPCRMEVLSRHPLVVADGAHNPYSMIRLREAVDGYLEHRRLLLIFGVSADKKLEEMLAVFAPLKPLVLATRSRHPRAAPPERTVRAGQALGLEVVSTQEVAAAVRQAEDLARPGDLVLATGSLFLAGEVREVLKGIAPEIYPELQPNPVAPPAGSL
ncbi:MAG: bifunctional folylpolyglutamate synthase/dihydrofolate synthase [Chloroflexi bacterium]|nr:bifunctional folylpolyglutamate synthase/dihydrofolate synthase [Chloroflexota bacterium]